MGSNINYGIKRGPFNWDATARRDVNDGYKNIVLGVPHVHHIVRFEPGRFDDDDVRATVVYTV